MILPASCTLQYCWAKQHCVHIQGNNKLNSNDANLLGQMVAEGVGIALLPEWEVDTVPLYLVYYKNRGSVPTIRSMVNFLFEKFQQNFIK